MATKAYLPFAANNVKPPPPSPPSPPPPPPSPPSPPIPDDDPIEEIEPQTTKRPRGRPPGSKNKPKHSMVILEDENSYKPFMMEIPAGMDIFDAIIKAAHDRRVSITVHSASGTISEITLAHPFSRSRPTYSLQGNYRIVSFTGTYINTLLPSNASKPFFCSFAIQLLRSHSNQNQTFNGFVRGKVLASTTVLVMASIFKKHELYKVSSATDANAEEENTIDLADRYAVVMNGDASNNGMVTNSNTISVAAIPNMSVAPNSGSDDVNLLRWNNRVHQRDNY